MKCAECNLCYPDEGDEIPYCHADPNWPAPCEHEDNYDIWEEDNYDD